MEQPVEEMKRYYQENLKPDDFHKLYQEELLYMRDVYFSSLNVLYNIIKKGCKLGSQHEKLLRGGLFHNDATEDFKGGFKKFRLLADPGKFTGNKLLEIGSGPTVHNIASASAYFSEIVQSDFVEANCEELRRWLKGKSQLDWSPFLEAVAQIEGYEDLSSGRREIELRIRKRVKNVVHCDVLSDHVIPKEVAAKFDLIVTSLTLECAAPDFGSFLAILKRINHLLRPGGGLIMIGFLNGKKWKTVGGEFHYLSMGQSDIDTALGIAGFKENDWTILPRTSSIPEFKYEYFYIVAAVKK